MAKGIPIELVEKVVARRGRRHAFEYFDPQHTALVIIDLTEATIQADSRLARLADPINEATKTVRSAGGVVAWVRPGPVRASETIIAEIVGQTRAQLFAANADPENPLSHLWSALEVHEIDLQATKAGWSAFFPGKCDLDEQLQELGIRNLLIAGTVTNVCCESSARDAVELGYRVTMLSDANLGHSYGLHEASLATFFRIFGDVRPVSDLPQIFAQASPPHH